MKIKLITAQGGKVGTFEIVPMQNPPNVIQWGTRTFVLRSAPMAGGRPEGLRQKTTEPDLIYAEAFAYSLPSNATPLDE